MSNWQGLNYAPVHGLIERVQRRFLRAQRKVLLRLFTEKGLLDLMARARAIRDNSGRNGDEKNSLFQRVYDAYVKLVTGSQTPHPAS